MSFSYFTIINLNKTIEIISLNYKGYPTSTFHMSSNNMNRNYYSECNNTNNNFENNTNNENNENMKETILSSTDDHHNVSQILLEITNFKN
jgi:hypothetical protein